MNSLVLNQNPRGRIDQFLELTKDKPLIAHNTRLDATMINNELKQIGKTCIPNNQ